MKLEGYRNCTGLNDAQTMRKALIHAGKAGYKPAHVDDGEEKIQARTHKEVMDAVFAVDLARIVLRHANGARGVLLVVLGNGDGCAVADMGGKEDFLAIWEGFEGPAQQ